MIFQYFSRPVQLSRTFPRSHLYSSTFQACGNPAVYTVCHNYNLPSGAEVAQYVQKIIICDPKYIQLYRGPSKLYDLAVTQDFQQRGICIQQRLRSACAYAQSDQSLCWLLEYSMTVKLLTEQHLEFLSLTGGCTG